MKPARLIPLLIAAVVIPPLLAIGLVVYLWLAFWAHVDEQVELAQPGPPASQATP